MAFLDPKHAVGLLSLYPGMRVADFGSGSGAYALEAARIVGSAGQVHAFDVQKDLVARLAAEAKERNLFALVSHWVDLERIEGSTLAGKTMDAVILANILFQVDHKRELVREARRVLKEDGKLLCIDWESSFGHLGPVPARVVQQKEAERLLLDEGFVVDRHVSLGDHHYAIVSHV